MLNRTKFACLLFCTFIAPWAQARDTSAYPNRPIKLIVTVPPGGAADFIARLLASKLSSSMGQSVIVENKAGVQVV
jgi:tripartite-type tricarboxylate transporter receptor subunit TctC